MQRINVVEIILLASLLGACATEPDVSEAPVAYSAETMDPATLQAIRAQATPDPVTTQTALAQTDELICHREAQPGSYIRVRRCYTRSQLNSQARSTQEWLADELSQSGTSRDSAVFDSTTAE
jgi:hypothetical protein